jgi:hypothetical protein
MAISSSLFLTRDIAPPVARTSPRPRPRRPQPASSGLAMRLFYRPVEDLIGEVAPKTRGRGTIPQGVLLPVWDLMREQAPEFAALADRIDRDLDQVPVFDGRIVDHRLFDSGQGVLRRLVDRARTDPVFAARGPAVRSGFWDIVEELALMTSLRHDLVAARTGLLAGGSALERVATRVLRLAMDSDKQPFFLLLLALARGQTTRDCFPQLAAAILNRPGAGSVGSLLNQLCRGSLDDARQALSNPAPIEEGLDATLGRLRDAVGLLSSYARSRTPGRDIGRASDKLRREVVGIIDRDLLPRIDKALSALDTLAPDDDALCRFRSGLEALIDSSDILDSAGLEDARMLRAMEAADAVERCMVRLASGTAPLRSLDILAGTLDILEHLCSPSRVLAILRTGYGAACADPPPDDDAGFLMAFVRLRVGAAKSV